MGQVIDSSVFIGAERGRADLRQKLWRLPQDVPAFIAAITASELLVGVHRAVTAAQRSKREETVEGILSTFQVLPFDLASARVHARLGADLTKQAAIVGLHDLVIAATAIATGLRVATTDGRSFRKIPGLEVDVW